MMQNHSIMQGIGASEHWLGLLDEHDVQFLALDVRDDSNLVKLFRSQPKWIVDFEDHEAVLFIRSGGDHAGATAGH